MNDIQGKLNAKEQELEKTLDEVEKVRSENGSLTTKYDELTRTTQEGNKSNAVVIKGCSTMSN